MSTLPFCCPSPRSPVLVYDRACPACIRSRQSCYHANALENWSVTLFWSITSVENRWDGTIYSRTRFIKYVFASRAQKDFYIFAESFSSLFKPLTSNSKRFLPMDNKIFFPLLTSIWKAGSNSTVNPLIKRYLIKVGKH